MTIVIPWSMTAGSWKHRLLPKLVAAFPDRYQTSFIDSTVLGSGGLPEQRHLGLRVRQ